MLCGRRAFPTGNVVESGYAILHSEPEPLPSSIPPLVVQVVDRCLEKEPARRFQSARDLAFNLDLVQTPTGAALPAVLASSQKPFSRWRRGLWPLAATVLTLGVGAGTYFVGRNTRLPTPSVQSLIARLGRVSAGRFNPDGRVIFSAAWDGQPLEVYAQAPGKPRGLAIGVTRHGAHGRLRDGGTRRSSAARLGAGNGEGDAGSRSGSRWNAARSRREHSLGGLVSDRRLGRHSLSERADAA
jgi:hypothetical protein